MDKQLEKTVLRRMVIQYHKDGLSIRKIAEKVERSKSNVQHIIKTYRQNGQTNAIKPPGRPGPTEQTLRRLGRQIEKTPAITGKELANHLDVSRNTVQKYTKMTEYNVRIARKKPLLSKKNINKRRLWANKMAEMPLDYWKKVIFSDESRFSQFSDAYRTFVYHKKNQAYQAKRLQATAILIEQISNDDDGQNNSDDDGQNNFGDDGQNNGDGGQNVGAT
ncbi:hypothetical protein DERF_013378 [Dermatophagoides farinae]|uniref:Uncharacterized protein n=1 Tax=Dermatophagoides farinae TaxID=6954 RepID=A0A922KYH9_DERFA|nr:hypothetical protein DERF_013378 [Dermatophagoides farinae]